MLPPLFLALIALGTRGCTWLPIFTSLNASHHGDHPLERQRRSYFL